jgi:hypothetical protein
VARAMRRGKTDSWGHGSQWGSISRRGAYRSGATPELCRGVHPPVGVGRAAILGTPLAARTGMELVWTLLALLLATGIVLIWLAWTMPSLAELASREPAPQIGTGTWTPSPLRVFDREWFAPGSRARGELRHR